MPVHLSGVHDASAKEHRIEFKLLPECRVSAYGSAVPLRERLRALQKDDQEWLTLDDHSVALGQRRVSRDDEPTAVIDQCEL
jgi:hypothetical protein